LLPILLHLLLLLLLLLLVPALPSHKDEPLTNRQPSNG
jgi:hypothetical protein